jgi:Tfp pilus assembly protein PilO
MITARQQAIEAVHVRRRENTQNAQAVERLTQEIKALETQINEFSAQRLAQNEQKNLLFIIQQIRKKGLVLKKYTGQKIKDKTWYNVQPAHYEFSGTLAQIQNFFTSIQTASLPIKCTNLILTHTTHDQFNVACDLSVFILKKLNPPT